MPAMDISTIPYSELKNDYYASKADAEMIERLAPWDNAEIAPGKAIQLRHRMQRNHQLMIVIGNEIRRRGLEL